MKNITLFLAITSLLLANHNLNALNCDKIKETDQLVSDILKKQNKEVNADTIADFLDKNMSTEQKNLYIAGSLACQHPQSESLKNKVSQDDQKKINELVANKEELNVKLNREANKIYNTISSTASNIKKKVGDLAQKGQQLWKKLISSKK